MVNTFKGGQCGGVVVITVVVCHQEWWWRRKMPAINSVCVSATVGSRYGGYTRVDVTVFR